jgi:hypothetical protein
MLQLAIASASSQVRSGQVRSGQVRSGQVRSGQVRSGQVRSGQDGAASAVAHPDLAGCVYDGVVDPADGAVLHGAPQLGAALRKHPGVAGLVVTNVLGDQGVQHADDVICGAAGAGDVKGGSRWQGRMRCSKAWSDAGQQVPPGGDAGMQIPRCGYEELAGGAGYVHSVTCVVWVPSVCTEVEAGKGSTLKHDVPATSAISVMPVTAATMLMHWQHCLLTHRTCG